MEEPMDWPSEGKYVINEVKDFVRDIAISSLESEHNDKVYLNATTAEGDSYCIELCQLGFRVVSKQFDTISPEVSEESQWYDTPYALFNSLSPMFNKLFSQKLAEKLQNLQRENGDGTESD
ncbi:GSK3-beta interaction protein [Bemisia tabaci]|nr:PREDICTED: UPF0279 protein CG14505-like [Bemisia tabaci]